MRQRGGLFRPCGMRVPVVVIDHFPRSLEPAESPNCSARSRTSLRRVGTSSPCVSAKRGRMSPRILWPAPPRPAPAGSHVGHLARASAVSGQGLDPLGEDLLEPEQ